MGKRPDEIDINDPNATYVMPTGTAGGNVRPEDIEQTRTEMTGTLSALGDKLNPHALATEAKDVASDTTQHAKEAVLEVVDHAKEALPGIVAGATDHAKEAVTEATDHAKEAVTEVVGQARDTVTDLVQQIRTALPEAAGNAARNAVSSAVDEVKLGFAKGFQTAQKALGGAADSAKAVASGASDQFKTAIDGTSPAGAGVTVQGITMTLTERIKENPPAALLAGLGLYLLFRGAGSKTVATSSGATLGYDVRGDASPTASVGANVSQAVSDAGSKIGDAAGAVQQKAGDLAGQVQDTAANVAGHVQDAASSLGTQVQEKAHQGGDALQRLLHDNPLAVGGIALGIGALAGLALPSTAPEQRLMGPSSGALVQKAQDAVQDKVHDLSDKVQSAVGVAGDAVNTIKENVSK